MIKLVKLGYVELGAKNLDAMTSYYEDIIGLTLIERGKNGSSYFSAGLDHHNIVLTPSESTGYRSMGLQLQKDMSLKQAAEELQKHGISSELKTDVHPGIPELLEFADVAGNIVQIYSEMELSGPGFKKTAIAPFNFNHVSFFVPAEEQKRAVDFYVDVLGMHITGWCEDLITFMTCNHHYFHVVNFVWDPLNRKGLHHLAFELKDWNQMARSHDLLAEHKIPILWGPSRHGAGHAFSSYHRDPDGNIVELTFDCDIYNHELGYVEPRPWHEEFPIRPKAYEPDVLLTEWSTKFEFDLAKDIK